MSARPFELAMYTLFGLGALPLAWVESRTLAYFLLNPGLIQERDAALEVLAVSTALQYAMYPLVPAVLMAVCFAIAGPRPARINVAWLLLPFALLSYAGSAFAFNTPGRLYLEAAAVAALLVLPIIFLVLRWRAIRERPDQSGIVERRTVRLGAGYLTGTVLLSSIDVVYEWFSPLVTETGESIDWCVGVGLRAGALMAVNHDCGFGRGLLTDVHVPQVFPIPVFAGAGPGSGAVAVAVWLVAVVACVIHLLVLRLNARQRPFRTTGRPLMQVECTRHVDAGEPDAAGMDEHNYEYDLYRFTEGESCFVARSYVDNPKEAHYLRVEVGGQLRRLVEADLKQPLFLASLEYLRTSGKLELNWLSGRGDGYEPVPIT